MGFGKPKSRPANQEDKGYRTIGALWKSKKFDGYNIMIDKSNGKYKAKGQLIFRDFATGELYKVKSVSCYDPKKPVKGLVYNLVINLGNEYQVEPLTDNDVQEAPNSPGTESQAFDSVEDYPDETQGDNNFE